MSAKKNTPIHKSNKPQTSKNTSEKPAAQGNKGGKNQPPEKAPRSGSNDKGSRTKLVQEQRRNRRHDRPLKQKLNLHVEAEDQLKAAQQTAKVDLHEKKKGFGPRDLLDFLKTKVVEVVILLKFHLHGNMIEGNSPAEDPNLPWDLAVVKRDETQLEEKHKRWGEILGHMGTLRGRTFTGIHVPEDIHEPMSLGIDQKGVRLCSLSLTGPDKYSPGLQEALKRMGFEYTPEFFHTFFDDPPSYEVVDPKTGEVKEVRPPAKWVVVLPMAKQIPDLRKVPGKVSDWYLELLTHCDRIANEIWPAHQQFLSGDTSGGPFQVHVFVNFIPPEKVGEKQKFVVTFECVPRGPGNINKKGKITPRIIHGDVLNILDGSIPIPRPVNVPEEFLPDDVPDVICPQCRCSCSPYALLCQRCHTPLKVEEQEEPPITMEQILMERTFLCPDCGCHVTLSDEFCPNPKCNLKLWEDEDLEEQSDEEKGKDICPKCSCFPVRKGQSHCQNCHVALYQCPNEQCDAFVTEDMERCPRCKEALYEEDEEAEVVVTPVQTEAENHVEAEPQTEVEVVENKLQQAEAPGEPDAQPEPQAETTVQVEAAKTEVEVAPQVEITCPCCQHRFPEQEHCPNCHEHLMLCEGCEVVVQASAERCYACGAKFQVEGEVQEEADMGVGEEANPDEEICPVCNQKVAVRKIIATGQCPSCEADLKICDHCSLLLLANEEACPRCDFSFKKPDKKVKTNKGEEKEVPEDNGGKKKGNGKPSSRDRQKARAAKQNQEDDSVPTRGKK